MERAYVATGEEVLHFFRVDEQRGLSAEAVTAARAKHGKNGKIISRGQEARSGTTAADVFCATCSSPRRAANAAMAIGTRTV